MKLLMTILLLSGIGFAQEGVMVRAEPMTLADQDARAKAYEGLVKAQANVHEVEYQIALRHHMKGEGDFGSIQHYEFDGGFIVLRNTIMVINTNHDTELDTFRTIPYTKALPLSDDISHKPAPPEPGNVIVYQSQTHSGDFRMDGAAPKGIIWTNANNTGSCTIEIVP